VIDLSPILLAPFLWGGRDPAIGLDCYGLACEARKLLLPEAQALPDYSHICLRHKRGEMPRTLIWHLLSASDRASLVPLPELGDLALVTGPRGPAITTYLGDWEGCQRVLGYNLTEEIELMPLASVKLLAYWRIE
jgi:hypothetical protein